MNASKLYNAGAYSEQNVNRCTPGLTSYKHHNKPKLNPEH